MLSGFLFLLIIITNLASNKFGYQIFSDLEKEAKLIKITKDTRRFKIKSILVVISIHHNNTLKIANVIAKNLNAQVKKPQEINPKEIQGYDLVGFGSGIYSTKHHISLLNLAEKLPKVVNKKAFIFSTAGITNKDKTKKDHSRFREKLQEKGYKIINDFQCKGFNTNSFLKYFKGMNKGRPNADDLKYAEEFARNLKKKLK